MKRSINITLLFFLLIPLTYHEAQTKWFKYSGNPVLEKGISGEWDDVNIRLQCVLWDGTKYNIWYGGEDEVASAIGYATSTDGINWIKYENNPVLEKGGPGEWDIGYIEPSSVLFNGTDYFMFYNGGVNYDEGIIGAATSSDGINWIKDTVNNPVLVSGESGTWNEDYVLDPHVIYENSVYKMWYGSDGWYENLGAWTWKLGYAESNDGKVWTKRTDPIMEEGDYETWANDLFSPCVNYEDNNYMMWYWSASTFSWNDHHQFNCATSSDGIIWVKSANNPVLERGAANTWDESAIAKPSVLKENSLFKMWYSGGNSGNVSIGYAEDFSNLVHADSVLIENIYVEPNADPLKILGRVISPDGHALSAKAIIGHDDGSTQDSVILLDDGLNGDGTANDGIYGGYWTPTNEKNYTVGIKTVDQETGFTRNGLNWNIIDRFTSKGPIVLENVQITSSDTIAIPGERLKYSFTMKNIGVSDSVFNIDVKLIIADTSITDATFGDPQFGDIAPGESIVSSKDFGIKFQDYCVPGNYEIELEITSNGIHYWTDMFTIEVVIDPSDVNELSNLPKKFALKQNYPNPFNPKTKIKYDIPENVKRVTKNVELVVYDILGKEVTTLVNEQQKAGYYEIEFESKDLTSGIYLYRLQAGDYVEAMKMILLK